MMEARTIKRINSLENCAVGSNSHVYASSMLRQIV